jgi:hypothetical protein
MTDTNVEVFKGRDARAATIERAAHPAGGAIATADLEGQFRIAVAISNAVEAVPRGYRKQPGAVLLALAWAGQHDLDILTTIQNVAFIEGKAVVDATMQRALAKRAGYELSITVGADAAEVGVHQGGHELGHAVYTMGDASQAGLVNKTNWKHNPEDMLVARATTRAIRRFAPDVLLGMLSSDEVDDPPADIVELVHPTPEPPVIVHLEGDDTPEPTPPPDDGLPANPEFDVDEPPADIDRPAAVWSTPTAMRADMRARGIRTPDAVREAHAIAERLGVEAPTGSLDGIYRHPDRRLVEAFAAWVRNHDEVDG